MSLKLFQLVCERNGNWPIEIVDIATLGESAENDRFFTSFCDPYMGHTFRLFYTVHPKKEYKEWLLRKIPEVKIKLDKRLNDQLFFQFILFYDFLRNLALKQCDLYMVTAVGFRVNTKIDWLLGRLSLDLHPCGFLLVL